MQKIKLDWTRVNNDVNGNPRYVIHCFNLVRDLIPQEISIKNLYEIAIKRANKIGGKKFHNKIFGGGIVFQSYSLPKTEQSIKTLIKNEVKKCKK